MRTGWVNPWRGGDLPPNVRALSLASFLQDVASEMVYPLLPSFLRRLGAGATVLGAMESAAEAVLALVKGWAGRASDRSGRRKPWAVAGYALSTLTRPGMAAALAAWQVVAWRVVDRLAKGLRTAPRDALIAESVAPARRAHAYSYHRGLDHLGAAVGPLIAAAILALAPGALRLVMALATLPALVGVLVVLARVREPARPPRSPGVAAAPSAATPTPPALRLPLVAFLLFSLGNATDAFLILRAANLGFSPFGLSLLWSGFHVAKWASSAPSGLLADRFGPLRPLLAGWLLYAVAYSGFAFTERSLPFLAWLGLYALHYGLREGAERSLVVRLAGPGGGYGGALGAFHLVSGLGLAAASVTFGVVWEVVSPPAAFLLGSALALLATALLAVALGAAGGTAGRGVVTEPEK